MDALTKENKYIEIGADQNVDYLKIEQHINAYDYVAFNQRVYEITRITHSTSAQINNLFINNTNKLQRFFSY